jgi:predicted cytidylate kinase
MTLGRSVVINGDLGSGKTTVSVLLAERLGLRRVSIGDFYRELAAQRGLSALQLNRHSELDDKIDAYIDQIQRDIVKSGEQLIVDSRLAWHFFTDALKVHLITEPTVAARRVLSRPTDVENYTSLEEARSQLASRNESERVRFLTKYGVDKTRLHNYDLVCDSTRATPEEVLATIIECLQKPPADTSEPICRLDPQRIFPTAGLGHPDSSHPQAPVVVGYVAPHFFVISGHERLRSAIRAGQVLVDATLAAEQPDDRVFGSTCDEYFREHATQAAIHAWEQELGLQLPALDGWAVTGSQVGR